MAIISDFSGIVRTDLPPSAHPREQIGSAPFIDPGANGDNMVHLVELYPVALYIVPWIPVLFYLVLFYSSDLQIHASLLHFALPVRLQSQPALAHLVHVEDF